MRSLTKGTKLNLTEFLQTEGKEGLQACIIYAALLQFLFLPSLATNTALFVVKTRGAVVTKVERQPAAISDPAIRQQAPCPCPSYLLQTYCSDCGTSRLPLNILQDHVHTQLAKKRLYPSKIRFNQHEHHRGRRARLEASKMRIARGMFPVRCSRSSTTVTVRSL